MRSILLACTLVLLPAAAFAGAKCEPHPKSEWIPEAEAKARLEAQYEVRKFKIDGSCYEIYGKNKEGKKVEIYFDTKTLAIVKADIEQ